MTDDTPDVQPDIEITDPTLLEEIRWRGMKDTGIRDGYLDLEVYRRTIEIVDGRQVGVPKERTIHGTIRADGTASLQFDPVTWTQLAEWQRHMQVLGNLYVRAWDLMGVPPPGYDEHGVATYATAVAARALREANDRVQTIGAVR